MLKLDTETEELFLDKIKQLLVNGETHQTVKITRGRREKRDADDVLIETNTVYQEDKQTTLKPTPKWVYDLLIKSVSTERAIVFLESEGYIVINPNAVINTEATTVNKGLSDFAVSEIKTKLLGIE